MRFAGVFGCLTLLLLGGLALFIFLVVRLAGGSGQVAAALWLSTCGLLLVVPIVAGWSAGAPSAALPRRWPT